MTACPFSRFSSRYSLLPTHGHGALRIRTLHSHAQSPKGAHARRIAASATSWAYSPRASGNRGGHGLPLTAHDGFRSRHNFTHNARHGARAQARFTYTRHDSPNGARTRRVAESATSWFGLFA